MNKRANLLRELFYRAFGRTITVRARGGGINNKKMLEELLGEKGKSMGRMFALQLKEDIATASAKHQRRQLTPVEGLVKAEKRKIFQNMHHEPCPARKLAMITFCLMLSAAQSNDFSGYLL